MPTNEKRNLGYVYAYDSNGYLNSLTTPLSHTRSWVYDALGGCTSSTDFKGTTTYTVDEWGRTTKKVFPDSSQYTYTYDGESHMTANTDSVGTWARSFDNAGRLLSESCSGTTGVSHTYDATGKKGLLSTTTDGAGRVETFTYTDRHELASVADTGTYAGTTSYDYDDGGNVQHTLYPNGLSCSRYYDDDGRISTLYNYNPGTGNSVLSSYAYQFDDDGRVTDAYEGTSATLPPTDNPTHTVFGYDGLGRLTGETRTGTNPTTRTYGYDPAGNRTGQSIDGTSTTLTVDADDQLNSTSGGYAYSYAYNNNGEQTGCTIGGVLSQFTYDYEGNLTGISSPGSVVTFAYDGLGRQTGRTNNGVASGYYLDGDTTLAEKQGSTWTDSYVWGVGQSRHNGEFVMHDALGSQCQLTNASDTITASDTMTAFGVGTNWSWTVTPTNKYWYKGLPTYREDGDGPQGGYFYTKVGARYYDSQFGRFITRDTVLTEKPYVYCNDDPVNAVDPTGHDKKKKDPWQAFLDWLSHLGGGSGGGGGAGGVNTSKGSGDHKPKPKPTPPNPPPTFPGNNTPGQVGNKINSGIHNSRGDNGHLLDGDSGEP